MKTLTILTTTPSILLAALSGLLIVCALVFYPKAWRYIESKQEDDSDLNQKI